MSIRHLIFLTVFSFLPLLFVPFTRLPAWDSSFPISGTVLAGLFTVAFVFFLVERLYHRRIDSEPDRARNSLLGLAFLTGLLFPIIFFVIAGLIGFAKEGMLFSTAGGPLEVAWAAVLMGAGFGWPMWLFSIPWAFVLVYGLARSSGPQKAAVLNAEDAE